MKSKKFVLNLCFVPFYLPKTYSLVVKRTAHNGIIVGSNPTKFTLH